MKLDCERVAKDKLFLERGKESRGLKVEKKTTKAGEHSALQCCDSIGPTS